MSVSPVMDRFRQTMAGRFREETNPFGDVVLHVAPPVLHGALQALRDSGLDLLLDVTAIDRLELPENSPRFEVVYVMRPSLGVQALLRRWQYHH